MKKIKAKNILECDFRIYGRYADLLNPGTPYIGADPIRFYRDIMPLGGNETLSLSVTSVEPMPMVVDTMEFHTATGECFLSLDGDTYICVGPATADPIAEPENMEAFFVPSGTAVYIHPGVWHYAPYPAGDKTIHSLVILPQRTYANDCIKQKLSDGNKLELDV